MENEEIHTEQENIDNSIDGATVSDTTEDIENTSISDSGDISPDTTTTSIEETDALIIDYQLEMMEKMDTITEKLESIDYSTSTTAGYSSTYGSLIIPFIAGLIFLWLMFKQFLYRD